MAVVPSAPEDLRTGIHSWGTPNTASTRRIMLLGSGELGKEVVIEAQRLGLETIAVDRYPDAPAMQVAHRHHVIDMTDPAALRDVIESERPHFILPEIEAIATPELERLESDGYNVIPTARATRLTMDREGIRRLAAEELDIPTSPYRFASTEDEYNAAIEAIGLPCVIKPTMSSSGKGQSLVKTKDDINEAWQYATEGSRTKTGRVIIEGFVDFDYEITLLTVRHRDGTSYCPPIGHRQEDGDYRESWQPMAMTPQALERSQDIAKKVTDALGGRGLFGVELFIKGDDVWFSEVSPRPHDTGLVTIATQELSEFALHVRAVTGLPIPEIHMYGAGASAVLLAPDDLVSKAPAFDGVDEALNKPGTHVRLFGKPETNGRRRLGVICARASNTDEARRIARDAAAKITIRDGDRPALHDDNKRGATPQTVPA